MLSRQESSSAYQIGIGDQIAVDSMTDDNLDRQLEVQPDGTVSLPLIGEVKAAGKTLSELRDHLVELLQASHRNPQITVSLITSNVALNDLIDAVDRRSGSGGQSQFVTVTPEGTIQLPGIGSVYVQGLTLEELQREIEARYAAKYGVGLSVTPLLNERAPSYVFLGGEVRSPGRYTLEGPTTVMQAITLAGGWNIGGNTNQIVVFRRDENWCLKATKIDLFKPLYGKDPCPVNDIWLRDNDLVIVPKRPILVADDLIDLYFTRGAYRVLPINFVYDFSNGSVIPIAAGP
jgi:polysaccharide export outer membrane protein